MYLSQYLMYLSYILYMRASLNISELHINVSEPIFNVCELHIDVAKTIFNVSELQLLYPIFF